MQGDAFKKVLFRVQIQFRKIRQTYFYKQNSDVRIIMSCSMIYMRFERKQIVTLYNIYMEYTRCSYTTVQN